MSRPTPSESRRRPAEVLHSVRGAMSRPTPSESRRRPAEVLHSVRGCLCVLSKCEWSVAPTSAAKEGNGYIVDPLCTSLSTELLAQGKGTTPARSWALTSKQRQTNSDLQHRRPWLPERRLRAAPTLVKQSMATGATAAA
nr:hypothetical protein Iba_chr13cCG14270 [Ipomoea batatas]